jgi:TRAP-type C4-dicarboxylate transport system permease small subunit
MYERRHDQLAPRSVFVKRIVASLAVALGLICVALLIGIAGYHFIAGFNWIDSLLEASMILGGMGPIKELPNDAAKIFASIYALFSGLLLIAMMGIILSPVIHRIMHKFHVDEKDVK